MGETGDLNAYLLLIPKGLSLIRPCDGRKKEGLHAQVELLLFVPYQKKRGRGKRGKSRLISLPPPD